MKKNLILLFSIGLIIFSSCKKEDGTNPSNPGENPSEHPIIWQYEYGQSQEYSTTIPAMDEQGNIYFSIQNGERQKTVYAYGITKDGEALWNKEYSAPIYCDISHVIYKGGKIFFFITQTDELYDEAEKIICLDAASGAELWSFTPDYHAMRPVQAIAVTDNYVLIAADWGPTSADSKQLHYFDHSGNLIKSVLIENHIQIELLSVVGQSLYLGLLNYALEPARLGIIKMNLESNYIDWEFIPDEYYDGAYFAQRSLAIDNDNRVLFIYRSAFGTGSHNLYILNGDGSLNKIISGHDDNHEFFDIIIDKDNNFYHSIDGFAKYAPAGDQVWKFHFESSLPVVTNFRTGCIIGSNDYIYHAEDDAIVNVNTSGELAWAMYQDTHFKDPGYPLLSADGNVIVVGDKYVTCIKGDGATIQDAPWPRIYCNNGNTSSR
jgi:outer membrane protein assembly factor BamB